MKHRKVKQVHEGKAGPVWEWVPVGEGTLKNRKRNFESGHEAGNWMTSIRMVQGSKVRKKVQVHEKPRERSWRESNQQPGPSFC
jgi:hypothetical protein